jgi:gamma-glutamyltranspeptidase / glutathione hydrolase
LIILLEKSLTLPALAEPRIRNSHVDVVVRAKIGAHHATFEWDKPMKFFEDTFPSRRSVVMSRNGMAASSQPLAVEAAINVLRKGGNAIDAAVTAHAVLSVIEPQSTGIGGDLFAIIWHEKEKRLVGVNASGKSAISSSAEALRSLGHSRVPLEGAHSITVPGALHGMSACLERFGTISLGSALEPAITFADQGFPVTEITSQMWTRAIPKLSVNAESTRVWLHEGAAPKPGELFRNADLARTLRLIAEHGPEYFYRDDLASRIAAGVRAAGGSIDLGDLASHESNWVEPISTSYRNCDVVELPPNNQGLAALLALNVLEGISLSAMKPQSADHLHCMIEAMRLGFADSDAFIGDPREPINLPFLLSKSYAESRRCSVRMDSAVQARSGEMPPAGDTVYVAVVDKDRNVVSMISSIFKSFGSGVTIPKTGIVMQNRGACFNLEDGHPNCLAPGKRPFHTIIPALLMKDGRPWVCFGVVGGLMQAQAHVQVVSNLVDFQMNPQTALDRPRFRILENGTVALEDGISEEVRSQLAERGHRISVDQPDEDFGGGQVILILDGTLNGGSDGRKDGCAIGY